MARRGALVSYDGEEDEAPQVGAQAISAQDEEYKDLLQKMEEVKSSLGSRLDVLGR